MKNKKSWRTTSMAVLVLVLFLIGLLMVWFGKITMTDFATYSGLLTPVVLVIYGWLVKDAGASSLDKGIADKLNELHKDK